MVFKFTLREMFRALSSRTPNAVIKAVVFDLDGTLIDSETGWFRTFQAATAAYERSWTVQDHLPLMSSPRTEWFKELDKKLGLGWDLGRYERMIDAVRVVVDPNYPCPFPGTKETLDWAFVRWPLVVASSSKRDRVLNNLKIMGVDRYFSVVIGGDDIQKTKPAPDTYLKAVAELDLPPQHCLAVEDSVNGVRSAISAGLQVLAVSNPILPIPESELALCHGVISNIEEVPSWFEFRLASVLASETTARNETGGNNDVEGYTCGSCGVESE